MLNKCLLKRTDHDSQPKSSPYKWYGQARGMQENLQRTGWVTSLYFDTRMLKESMASGKTSVNIKNKRWSIVRKMGEQEVKGREWEGREGEEKTGRGEKQTDRQTDLPARGLCSAAGNNQPLHCQQWHEGWSSQFAHVCLAPVGSNCSKVKGGCTGIFKWFSTKEKDAQKCNFQQPTFNVFTATVKLYFFQTPT